MNRNDFYKSWSDLHGSAEIVGIVKIWLTISYFVAKA
ncbi:MAG: CDP-alcohol phosphatidyltransferase family protein, partial [Actinobacteria bacterium]|nr:CDP-alcohol phosphatidyltransferase family protein [Actinomycetota bacterium]